MNYNYFEDSNHYDYLLNNNSDSEEFFIDNRFCFHKIYESGFILNSFEENSPNILVHFSKLQLIKKEPNDILYSNVLMVLKKDLISL